MRISDWSSDVCSSDLFGAGMIPVDLTGNAPQPDPKYPVGYDHPKVNAGSATYPLDMIAALSPDRKALTIAVVNATHTPQSVSIAIDGARPTGKIGSAHVCTPVTNAHLVCRTRPEHKKDRHNN